MLSDEEKKAIKELTEIKELFEEDLKENYEVTATLDQIDLESLVIVLNLIKKQSKEIEELKEECKEVVCVPEGTCFMIEPKDVDKKWEDKIKAKIEEYRRLLYSYEKELEEKLHFVDKGSMNCIIAQLQVLESLLEKA